MPEGGKVNADHNHSRIAVEQEATVVLREIRERCLRELTKRPILIIRETLATCSQEVRDYLNIGAIRQDMRRMRSSAAGELSTLMFEINLIAISDPVFLHDVMVGFGRPIK